MTEIKKLIEQDKFEEAEKLVLESKVSKKTQEDNLLLFRLLYLQEKHQEAIHCGEALLLSGYEADANIYFMLGTSYSWLEQYDEAISNLAKAIKLDPNNVSAHVNFGLTCLREGKYDKAIEAYEQAIKLRPNDALLHLNLGNAYASKEEYDQAIVAYKQSIKLKPDDADAHYNLNNVQQINKWLKQNYPDYANLSEEDKRAVRQQYNQEEYAEANKS